MVAAIKSAPNGVKLVESECFNEALGATLDSNLVWTDRYPWTCPMLGSVYGGWFDWNSELVYRSEDMISFTSRIAKDVFWGGAMGGFVEPANWWCSTRDNPRTIFMIELAKFRRAAKDFLVYGDMVRPPDLKTPPVWLHLAGWWCTYFDPDKVANLDIEAIERDAWRAPNGDLGLALMNADAKAQTVQFDLSTMSDLKPADVFKVIQVEGAPPLEAKNIKFEGSLLTIDLPSRKPVLIVLGKTKEPHP